MLWHLILVIHCKSAIPKVPSRSYDLASKILYNLQYVFVYFILGILNRAIPLAARPQVRYSLKWSFFLSAHAASRSFLALLWFSKDPSKNFKDARAREILFLRMRARARANFTRIKCAFFVHLI